jgi:hypothetical protein
VLGSRLSGDREPGSLAPAQIVAGHLAGLLVRLLYGARFTDMSPFRAIRRDALERLGMREETFGWNLEMQIRVAAAGLRTLEVPVGQRRRAGGVSKVSGSVAAVRAAAVLISTFLRLALGLRRSTAATGSDSRGSTRRTQPLEPRGPARQVRRRFGRLGFVEAHHREETPGAQPALLTSVRSSQTSTRSMSNTGRQPSLSANGAMRRSTQPHASPAGLAFLGAEVIDDDHLAARAAHARSSRMTFGIGHDRHHVHGDDRVEGGGGELQIARVHLVQAGDVGQALGGDALARLSSISGERSMPTISRCRA